jgi:hypothetical protein
MNPFGGSGRFPGFGGSGGDDFFGGMGGGMGGPMGGMGGMGGGMGGGGPMGGMGCGGGGGNPRQGGHSFSSAFDSSRPEGQQYQEHHEPFGDYGGSSRGGGGMGGGMGGDHEPAPRGRGFMFSGLTRADNPFRRTAGRAPEQPGYCAAPQQRFMGEGPRGDRVDPRYTSQYEGYPGDAGQRGQAGGLGRLFDFGSSQRQQPSGQQGYYEDEYDSEGEYARPQRSHAPQQAYGGGGGARRTGGSGGGRLFNYDRNGRRYD